MNLHINNYSFNAKKDCFIQQYSEYQYTTNHPFNKLNDTKIDGNRTQTENIADNGGIRAAYRAYSQYI